MHILIIATEERLNPLDHKFPEGTRVTEINLADKPDKGVFIDRFTGAGAAFYRSLERTPLAERWRYGSMPGVF